MFHGVPGAATHRQPLVAHCAHDLARVNFSPAGDPDKKEVVTLMTEKVVDRNIMPRNRVLWLLALPESTPL
jgi:hypothetical protein